MLPVAAPPRRRGVIPAAGRRGQLAAPWQACRFEAIDWYNQRVDAAKDPHLKAILAHNRDEEKEHASMLLEWIRRKDEMFNEELRDYLFSEKSIASLEEQHHD